MPIVLLPETPPQPAPSDPSLADHTLPPSKLSSSDVSSAQTNSSTDSSPYPFDPLSESEIEAAVAVVRKHPQCQESNHQVDFNAVTLWEPRKAEMLAWLADPQHSARPRRVADVVFMVWTAERRVLVDASVDLEEGKVVSWEENREGVQPLVCLCGFSLISWLGIEIICLLSDRISVKVGG